MCFHAGQSSLPSHRGTCMHARVCGLRRQRFVLSGLSLVVNLQRLQPTCYPVVLIGKLGGALSLQGLSLPTQDCRWPRCQPQTCITHTESALDNTTSLWAAGWAHVLRWRPWFSISSQKASVRPKCTWRNMDSLPTCARGSVTELPSDLDEMCKQSSNRSEEEKSHYI